MPSLVLDKQVASNFHPFFVVFDFLQGMSYCAKTPVGSLENIHKHVVFKDLNRLWEKDDPKLPWKKGDYNETNTVLLDDSPYKALLNPVSYFAMSPHLLESYLYNNSIASLMFSTF